MYVWVGVFVCAGMNLRGDVRVTIWKKHKRLENSLYNQPRSYSLSFDISLTRPQTGYSKSTRPV